MWPVFDSTLARQRLKRSKFPTNISLAIPNSKLRESIWAPRWDFGNRPAPTATSPRTTHGSLRGHFYQIVIAAEILWRDKLQLRSGGMFRRDRGCLVSLRAFVVSPKLPCKAKPSYRAWKRNASMFRPPSSVSPFRSHAAGPADGTAADANIEEVISEIGDLPSDVSKQVTFLLRLKQIRDFAKELQNAGMGRIKIRSRVILKCDHNFFQRA